ncbi:hypothetical protein C4565_02470 [Candidatus Parcubacteria bacterium]|jgi:hypothetical protein|nr:MAG: hypothetical protein C4565_02470 [Candidatus Parcubacteria bacterium]
MKKSIQTGMAFLLGFVLCVPVFFVSAKGNENTIGAEHRNTVATFVQTLLESAEKENGEIGAQIKVIAEEQNNVKNEVSEKIEKIQNRNKIKTFFIGTDYKNIGQLRSSMVKTNNQIDALKRVLERTTNTEMKTVLEGQTQVLEKEQQKIEEFLKSNESKFSIFGWLTKLFVK